MSTQENGNDGPREKTGYMGQQGVIQWGCHLRGGGMVRDHGGEKGGFQKFSFGNPHVGAEGSQARCRSPGKEFP